VKSGDVAVDLGEGRAAWVAARAESCSAASGGTQSRRAGAIMNDLHGHVLDSGLELVAWIAARRDRRRAARGGADRLRTGLGHIGLDDVSLLALVAA